MKKALIVTLLGIVILFAIIYAFIYFVPYSEGVRTGELIKISKKGVVFKTWEGEISQGISGAQIFKFSVLTRDEQVIHGLEEYQGQYVKLTYVERYATFFWLGDTKYFITQVEKETSPHLKN